MVLQIFLIFFEIGIGYFFEIKAFETASENVRFFKNFMMEKTFFFGIFQKVSTIPEECMPHHFEHRMHVFKHIQR